MQRLIWVAAVVVGSESLGHSIQILVYTSAALRNRFVNTFIGLFYINSVLSCCM